jgi:membrane-associated phospholipid phosphatase
MRGVSERWRGLAVFLLIAAAAMGVATLLDRPLLDLVERLTRGRAMGEVAGRWWAFLRLTGYVDLWLPAVAAFWCLDRRREEGRARRAAFLLASILLSGAAAEGLKLAVRRERPATPVAEYVRRPFADQPWRTTTFGLPSSHAAVAFGAAWALGRLVPAARPVWLALAAGCGATRLLGPAHYPSDVVAAALVAYAVAWALARGLLREARPPGDGTP